MDPCQQWGPAKGLTPWVTELKVRWQRDGPGAPRHFSLRGGGGRLEEARSSVPGTRATAPVAAACEGWSWGSGGSRESRNRIMIPSKMVFL